MVRQSPEQIAFPELTPQQMEQVAAIGERHEFQAGDILVRAGQRDYSFWVVEQGHVDIMDPTSESPRLVAQHPPNTFVGDIDILTGRPAVISAVCRTDGAAYQITGKQVRRMLQEIPEFSDLLLESFQMRRQLLEAGGFQGLRVFGTPFSQETLRLREFFHRNHVPHTFLDVNDESASRQLHALGIQDDEIPVVACNFSQTVNKRPSLSKVAECIGITRKIDDRLYDLVVVGAGPAGLTAAIYAASEGLQTLVVDRVGPGGQAGSSSRIENFIGFPSGISGSELANRAYIQALKFGAHFTAPINVLSVDGSVPGEHRLELCTGAVARTKCLLVASGVSYRQLDLEGCQRLEGAGVYYAATTVEARVCRNAPVVVVGGGNSAGQAAMYLADHARDVKLVIRGESLAKGMSAYLSRRVMNHPRIELIANSEIEKVNGDCGVESVSVHSALTDERTTLDCQGLFIFIGARPHTDWLPSTVRLDEKGFIDTGAALQNDERWPLQRAPFDLETTAPGILAAGDVRSGTTKRCGFAVGDGSLAVTCVHRYLNQG
ncbi:FAD-dependent oxidoreductase [Planctomicrobium piriforme]|uniref:Thioredoxin reductase (NADPH) n=1 Tax=Planctomicrobium piriforme TaxID=1576369 RepID=A0A1I3G6Y1_9PLAN|nr:cyclic nucleotide-binding domain-containing thioredoxin-disulfide reductase [Planctomicrobium piriforme]SFI19248.1 thioredoxin reductase (NADPH) [Planctomicrobium piriforme]